MRVFVPALLAVATVSPSVFADEQTLMIDGAGHQVPVTITLPDGEGPFPFVVMYHGTGSNRHEAGNGYDLLAPELAAAGIASARFDFAGNGDSKVDYTEYTYTSGIADGAAVIDYMRGLDQIDDARLGVMGWSQGGSIAMLTAARRDDVKSLVTWAGALDMSGAFAELYDQAKEKGFAVAEFEWRSPLNVSIDWFEEVRKTDIAAELGNYHGAVLAIAGSDDVVVPPAATQQIVDAAAGSNEAVEIIEGADHTFSIFTGDMTAFDQLMKLTVDRFAQTL